MSNVIDFPQQDHATVEKIETHIETARTELGNAGFASAVGETDRMAFHEPTDEMRETGRQILRGEISADDAVAASTAKHQAAERR